MAYFLEYCYFLKKEKNVRSKMEGKEEERKEGGQKAETKGERKERNA